MYNFTKEELTYFEKVIDAVSRGFIVNGKELTDLYNKIFNRSLTPTSCMSCLKGRYNQIKVEYDAYMKNSTPASSTETTEGTTLIKSKTVRKVRSKA